MFKGCLSRALGPGGYEESSGNLVDSGQNFCNFL